MHKLLVVLGIALAPFTEGMSLFFCLIGLVSISVDSMWAHYEEGMSDDEQTT